MERNVEMQNAPAGMFDNEEAVQGTEIQVGNGEEVERGNRFAMIIQKSQPLTGLVLLWDALQTLQIARHGRLGDAETEQEQLPMDARCTPSWIFFSCDGLSVGLLPPSSAFRLAAGVSAISRTSGIRPDAKRRQYPA